MSTNVDSWWEEYDRCHREKLARKIARWIENPLGKGFPKDEDLWDDAEREAIMTASLSALQARFPSEVADQLKVARKAPNQQPPSDDNSGRQRQRRLQFVDKLEHMRRKEAVKAAELG